MPSVLTSEQKTLLLLFSKHEPSNEFYLTGGTALCEFYIPYRYSDDLDFFDESEFDIGSIISFFKSIKKELGYKKLQLESSFNRNLVFLEFLGGYLLKCEFTYYPFTQVEKPKKKNGIYVDSPIDLAVNKLFTIYQKPRTRDFLDLFMLIQKYEFDIPELLLKAKAKFDWHVDAIQLSERFLHCDQLEDYPRLIEAIEDSKWLNFFKRQARSLIESVTR